ncbi:hypothetical protein CSUI_006913, partial [Cystoisospora suis]
MSRSHGSLRAGGWVQSRSVRRSGYIRRLACNDSLSGSALICWLHGLQRLSAWGPVLVAPRPSCLVLTSSPVLADSAPRAWSTYAMSPSDTYGRANAFPV